MPTDPNAVKLIWIFTAILLPIIPALLLFKLLPLSTADVSGPFHGLQIKLGGAVGAYFLLVLVIYFSPRPTPTPYEVWTVKGFIQDENGKYVPPEKMNMNIEPRSVEYLTDGSFEIDVLVKRGQSGRVKFPTLMVEWQPRQFSGNAAVHLDSVSQPIGKKYKLKVDQASREIEIAEPIQLAQQEKPYAPAEQAPNPTVLPVSVAPSNSP